MALWAHVVKYTNVPPTFGGLLLNYTQWDVALRGEAGNNTQLPAGLDPVHISLVAGRQLPELLRYATSMLLGEWPNVGIDSSV